MFCRSRESKLPRQIVVLTASDDKTLKLWSCRTGACFRNMSGHGQEVTSAMFSQDGDHIVSACWDGFAYHWVTTTGKLNWFFLKKTQRSTEPQGPGPCYQAGRAFVHSSPFQKRGVPPNCQLHGGGFLVGHKAEHETVVADELPSLAVYEMCGVQPSRPDSYPHLFLRQAGCPLENRLGRNWYRSSSKCTIAPV